MIVGPSSCGKTTLLRMIDGLETPGEEEIRIDNVSGEDVSVKNLDIAINF